MQLQAEIKVTNHKAVFMQLHASNKNTTLLRRNFFGNKKLANYYESNGWVMKTTYSFQTLNCF